MTDFKELMYSEDLQLQQKIIDAMLAKHMPFPTDESLKSACEQAEILLAVFDLYVLRNAASLDAWKHIGYLGNLLVLWGKVSRLMNKLWYTTAAGKGDKPLDDAADAVNYAVFFIRSYLNKSERGDKA